MYTKSYIFGDTTSIGTLIKNGDRILVTCTFTIDDVGSNVAYLASSKGLYITKYGSTKMEFNFDEFFLAPNEYRFEVQDRDDEFNNLLYEGADVDKVYKDFFVKVELKHPGGSYETKFSGKNAVENIEYDPVKKLHVFTALPNTNVLNETAIFQKTYDATKFNYDFPDTYPNNPLSLTFYKYSLLQGVIKWNWITVKSLIEKMFQLINASIAVTFIQNWLFYGKFGVTESSALTFNDLIADNNWLGSIFAEEKHSDIKTIGDLLKVVAFDFGCVAGAQSQDAAFFKQIYYVDTNNLQTLGPLVYGHPKKKYKYSKIDYARITSSYYEQDAGQRNRYVEQQFRPQGQAPYYSFDKNQGDNGLEKEIVSVASCPINLGGGWTSEEFVSNLKALISGSDYYSIYAVKNPFVNIVGNAFPYQCPTGFFPLPTSLAEYHYHLKGLLYKTQVYVFKIRGLQQNFLQGFAYGGFNFSVVSIEENFDDGTTTLEAIKVSAVTVTGGDGGGGTSITTPLTVIPMTSFSAEASFSYASIGIADPKIADMNENDWLEGFYINLDQVFLPGKITVFTIHDGSETLLTLDKIMGKLVQPVKPQMITKVKKYTAADSLYLHVEGDNTTTQGAGQIIIRKMKREAA